MASVTATIGDGRTGGTSDLQWGSTLSSSRLSIDIPSALTRDATSTAKLRYLRIVDFGLVQINTESDTQSSAGAGPDLSDAWELFNPAIVIRAGTLTLELPGSRARGNLAGDASEPYRYNIGRNFGDFITAYRRLSQADRAATELILADEIVVRTINLGLTAMAGTGAGSLVVNLVHHEVPEVIQLVPETMEGSGTGSMEFLLEFKRAVQSLLESMSGTGSGALDFSFQHRPAQALTSRMEGSAVGSMSFSLIHNEVPETIDLAPAFRGSGAGGMAFDFNHIEVAEAIDLEVPNMAGSGAGTLSVNLQYRNREETNLLNIVEGTYGDYRIQWANSVREVYTFFTGVVSHRAGTEQRIAYRSEPRLQYEFEAFLDPLEFRTFMARNSSFQGRDTYIPHPRYRFQLPSFLSRGEGSVRLDDRPAWIRPGANVFCKVGVHVIPGIVESVASALPITGGPVNVRMVFGTDSDLPTGTYIYFGVLVRPVSGNLVAARSSRAGTMRVNAAADPVFNWMRGFSSIPPASLGGREYFDIAPNFAGAPQIGTVQGWEDIDFRTGAVDRIFPRPFASRSIRLRYVLKSDTEERILGLFHRCRGRQKGFWMPSFVHEVAIPPGITSGRSMNVPGLALSNAYNGSNVFKYLRFVHRRGSFVIGVDSVEAGENVSTINFSNPLPEVLPEDDIKMISWIHLCRFETDSLSVDWRSTAVGETVMTLRTLPAETIS